MRDSIHLNCIFDMILWNWGEGKRGLFERNYICENILDYNLARSQNGNMK